MRTINRVTANELARMEMTPAQREYVNRRWQGANDEADRAGQLEARRLATKKLPPNASVTEIADAASAMLEFSSPKHAEISAHMERVWDREFSGALAVIVRDKQ